MNTAIRSAIACRDCGLIQGKPAIPARHVVECSRCGRVLITPTVGRVDLPLALAAFALLLMIGAALSPLLTVSTLGAERESGLLGGVRVFTAQGFPELGALVLMCCVVLPFVYLLALVWVLGCMHFGATRRSELGPLYRWVSAIRAWMMLEVFLVGGFIAYTRIQTQATVDIDPGGWCIIAATFATMLALTQLDDHTVWDALPGGSPSPDEGRSPALACGACDLILPMSHAGRHCPRCSAKVHSRKPDSARRTAALVIAGYLLYIPANLLPVTSLDGAGGTEEHTIMSGVFELIHNNLWPLAVLVFAASIILPLMKLLSLSWMLLAVHWRSAHMLRTRTGLYRAIEAIGRWSNIDVFMGSVLAALLQFGVFSTVRAEPGLVAFAAVVVLTMIATETFDPKLMWDAAAESTA